jgi:hypothetical protein
MPRIIEQLEDWVEYTPELDDNRSDESPVTMEIRPMSAEEYRASQRSLAVGSQKKIIARSQKVIQRTLARRVRNVRNYVMFGKAITTGEDLALHGENDMCDDVYKALHNISALSDGLKKKSNSPSGSSKSTTSPPTGGDARAVQVTSQEIDSGALGIVTPMKTPA